MHETLDLIVALMLIGLFILFTNPISSQVLARSAHRAGVDKSPLTGVDRLAERETQP
jgi:multicomponent Na+:H+ antiporter subunit G